MFHGRILPTSSPVTVRRRRVQWSASGQTPGHVDRQMSLLGKYEEKSGSWGWPPFCSGCGWWRLGAGPVRVGGEEGKGGRGGCPW